MAGIAMKMIFICCFQFFLLYPYIFRFSEAVKGVGISISAGSLGIEPKNKYTHYNILRMFTLVLGSTFYRNTLYLWRFWDFQFGGQYGAMVFGRGEQLQVSYYELYYASLWF